MNYKKTTIGLVTGIGMLLATMTPAFADSVSVNFENPPYTLGSISGQNGWSNAVSPSVDQAVVTNNTGISSFGTQSFRMSDAYQDGAFGDWVFAKPLANAVGEADSTDGSFSPGTLQRHFDMQFDITSASPSSQQPGLHVSVSPDRGDGSRMSYLRFEDGTDGIDVFFDDVTGTSNPANFHETEIASGLNRATAHHVELTMDALDGPSNDVVKVWIDGVLKVTGTSWENYYRFDNEASAEQSPRIVKTVIFQSRGSTTNPADQGKGFLFDNFSMSSGPTPSTVTVTIAKYLNGSLATATSANNASFPMTATWNATNIGAGTGMYSLGPTGFNNPNPYQATTSDMTQGASYTTSEVTNDINSSSNVLPIGAACQTGRTRLVGYSAGDTLESAAAASTSSTAPNFTNLQSNKFVIVRNESCTNPPTTFAQCSGNGWKTFNNPSFKNAGLCVAYVAKHQHNVDGSITYTAGFVRHAIFVMNSAVNNGAFFYWDAHNDWYTVNVSDVNINGNTAWFAGRVTSASQSSWVGKWLFAKVVDNSPDQIWGSFTDKTTAEDGVTNMTPDPTDGPFSVTSGNLTVH